MPAPPPKKVVPKPRPGATGQAEGLYQQPMKLPMERMIVVFDYNTKGRIIFCQGATIEPEAREEAALEYHDIKPPPEVLPGSVWIYEVEPVCLLSGKTSHSGGTWRYPKAVWEMAAFHTGDFLGIWKDIPEGPEYKKLYKASLARMEARLKAAHDAELAVRPKPEEAQ